MASSYVKALDEEKTPEVNAAVGGVATTPYTAAMGAASAAADQTPLQPVQPAAQTQAVQPAAAQQTATYIDDSGNKQTGYVSALSNDSDLNYWQKMEKFYNDQYEAAVKANNEAAQAKYRAAMEQINTKIKALEDSYAGTNRQLYRDFMENQRVLPQQMAALGYSGGMSESSRLRLTNSYEEALAQNEREKAGQIAGLNAQGVQYQYDAEAEAARLNAEADQQRRSYLTALLQQERQEGLNQAQEIGNATGDYSRLLQFGYTQEEVNAFRKAWIQANPALAQALGYVTGGRKTGGGRGAKDTGDEKENPGITIDYDSINKLGMGPISADTLSQLIESGQVTESTDKNGRVSYSRNQSYKPQSTNPFRTTSIQEASKAIRANANNAISRLGKTTASR